MTSQQRRAILPAIIVATAAIVYAYLVHYSLTVPLNSDIANYMLVAQTMAKGNVLLRGWLLPPDPYWVTDLLLYAPMVKVFGVSPFTSHAAAALVYLLLCTVAVALVLGGPRKDARVFRLGLVLLPMLALSPFLATLSLVGPQHVGTIVVVLLVIFLWPEAGSPMLNGRSLGAFVLLYMVNLSDPFTLWVYTLPLLAMALLTVLLRRAHDRRQLWSPLLIALSADVLAVFTRLLLSRLGDLRTYGLTASLARDLGRNLHLLAQGFPMMYGVAFTGSPIDQLAGAIHLLILIPALLLLAIVPLRWLVRARGDLPSVLLSISAWSVLAEFVLSGMAGTLATLRYLLPSFVFSLLVLAREIDLTRVQGYLPRWLSTGTQRLAVVAIAILLLFPGIGSVIAPGGSTPWPKIAAWLEQHHLSRGYGPYWDASILDLYSGGRVTVRAITGSYSLRREVVVVPYLWFVERSWYGKDIDTRFVIYDPADYGDVTRSTIAETFGPPAREHHIGKYTILVWDHPIYAALPSR